MVPGIHRVTVARAAGALFRNVWMRPRVRAFHELTREAFRISSARGVRLLGAATAFYAFLSVVPILVIALEIAGRAVSPAEAGSTATEQLARFVGREGARTIMDLVTATRSSSSLDHLAGVAILTYGATRLFSGLTRALDLLWDAPPPPEIGLSRGIIAQLRSRLLSVAMVVLVAVLLVALVVGHAGLATARLHLGVGAAPVFRVLEAAGSFAVTASLFSFVYWLLPRVRLSAADALTGGALTAALFTAGALVVTAWVSHRDTSVYGAAGSIVVLLLWVNYSAQAFFLGAAFTVAHYRRRAGSAAAATAQPSSLVPASLGREMGG